MSTFTGPVRLCELADGVHAFLQPDGGWCLNNAGLLVGGGTAVLVDTAATEARASRLRELAVTAAGAIPRVVVNTHAHGDHTFGNGVFPEALVVGHEGTRAEAERAGLHLTTLWPDVEWGKIEVVLPQATFRDPIAARLGGHDIELHSFASAHSASDTVVWLPGRRVLFAGDLVLSGVTPFVLTGSISGLRAALGRLREFDAATVVPGHGPVGGPELFDQTERYLGWLTELARAGIAAGLTPLQAARDADLGEFAGLIDSERLAPNLHRAYVDLGAEPADLDQLLADMTRLHGGMPACHA
ncbi:Cyclase [Frankia canadensis]|uniref:Cyclase n=1 Tax=Frankia canadensis TaxID=1836972 RepID=A0A2I2KNB8_9ACTN|nr:MBL fold metallo-hydrolase [Frankia canadensis]SNQ47158.1 Cyclase [Frankia canadensis]SOU54448.1 Cyclase [Frankia canadensis]